MGHECSHNIVTHMLHVYIYLCNCTRLHVITINHNKKLMRMLHNVPFLIKAFPLVVVNITYTRHAVST